MEEGSRDSHEERPARCSARRRLFVDDEDGNGNNDEINENQLGKMDNETNRFIEETRKVMENAKERWNFDFEKEEPLPGRYEWVKVNENFSDDVPDKNSPTDENITHETSNKSEANEIDIKPTRKD